jgi:hypothetical protein
MPKPPKPPTNEPLDPWEQQPGESQPAFEAFALYRDLGPSERSTRRVARDLDKNHTLIGQWSGRHRWVERVRAWDAEQDRQRRAALSKEAIEAGRRHGQALGAALGVLIMPFRALGRRRVLLDGDGNAVVNEDGDVVTVDRNGDLEKLPTKDLIALAQASARYLPALVQAERLVRGEATSIPAEPVRAEGRAVAETDEERMRAVFAALEQAGVVPPQVEATD